MYGKGSPFPFLHPQRTQGGNLCPAVTAALIAAARGWPPYGETKHNRNVR